MGEERQSSTPVRSDPNGLRMMLNERLLDALTEVAALRAELRAGLKAIDDRLSALGKLEQRVSEHDRQITRLRTLWTTVAAAVGFAAASLKDWLFGSR